MDDEPEAPARRINIKTTHTFWEFLQTEHRLLPHKTVQESRVQFFDGGLDILTASDLTEDGFNAHIAQAREHLAKGVGQKTIGLNIPAEADEKFRVVYAKLPNIQSQGAVAELIMSIGLEFYRNQKKATA